MKHNLPLGWLITIGLLVMLRARQNLGNKALTLEHAIDRSMWTNKFDPKNIGHLRGYPFASHGINVFSITYGYNQDGSIEKSNFVMFCRSEPIVTKLTNGTWEVRFK